MKHLGLDAQSKLGNDNVGRGMDSALVMLVFLGIGYALDRWFGTRPVFMVVFAVLGGVGSFVRVAAGYSARMTALEAERTAGSVAAADGSIGKTAA